MHWVHCTVFRTFSPMQFLAAISNPIWKNDLYSAIPTATGLANVDDGWLEPGGEPVDSGALLPPSPGLPSGHAAPGTRFELEAQPPQVHPSSEVRLPHRQVAKVRPSIDYTVNYYCLFWNIPKLTSLFVGLNYPFQWMFSHTFRANTQILYLKLTILI